MKLSDAVEIQAFESLYAALRAEAPEDRSRNLKRCLAAIWRAMDSRDRGAFLQAIDGPPNFAFLEWRERFPKLGDPTLERAYRAWGQVAYDINEYGEPWQKGIAGTISKQLKFPNWSPSDKQAAQMKKFYLEWKAARDAEPVVLEAAE